MIKEHSIWLWELQIYKLWLKHCADIIKKLKKVCPLFQKFPSWNFLYENIIELKHYNYLLLMNKLWNIHTFDIM